MCSGLVLVSFFHIHLCNMPALDSIHVCFSLGLCHQRPMAYFGRSESCLFKMGPVKDTVTNQSLKAASTGGLSCWTLWWRVEPFGVSGGRITNSSSLLDQVLRMLLKL